MNIQIHYYVSENKGTSQFKFDVIGLYIKTSLNANNPKQPIPNIPNSLYNLFGCFTFKA